MVPGGVRKVLLVFGLGRVLGGLGGSWGIEIYFSLIFDELWLGGLVPVFGFGGVMGESWVVALLRNTKYVMFSSRSMLVSVLHGETCVACFARHLGCRRSNGSVGSRTDNAPYVVLLDPEGCTSSKLPARLDGEVSFKTKNAL